MNIRVQSAELFFIPVTTRIPLKFGTEVVESVTCARARVEVEDTQGRRAEGWGETPLSVQWVWPSATPYEDRHQALKEFTLRLCEAVSTTKEQGHALELGSHFTEHALPDLLQSYNSSQRSGREPMPWLAALVCFSVLDQAVHDAYGKAAGQPVYETYGPPWLDKDLSQFLKPADGSQVSFAGKFPRDFLIKPLTRQLPAWHLVGGLDALDRSDLTGKEPQDGHPVMLEDWIHRDGLKCLKIKLRGNDAAWDYERILRVGRIAIARGVDWLSADFNCTVRDPAYVMEILDRLRTDAPRMYGMLLYVEQPFPYELERDHIDVHRLASCKPLFLDESAHDWRMIRLGRELGWNGVALKTCKSQTGALLSLCWAKAHGMALMVQDLTNPMLAQIPHVLLAAHAGTLMGVETNCSQYYPDASLPESVVHPGLYQRRNGQVDWSTLKGPGFGSRLDEIDRNLLGHKARPSSA
ncbi:MAG: hypothetical protein FJ405_08505 [Verrucomicrobia bacterium]|nr:hypothetical protein [Verrucomicrobiota bacterium]